MIVYKSYLFGNERPITFDTEIEVSVFVVLATAEEIAELTSAHEVSSSHPGKQFLERFFFCQEQIFTNLQGQHHGCSQSSDKHFPVW